MDYNIIIEKRRTDDRYRKSPSRYCKCNRNPGRSDYNRKALKGQSQIERTGQQTPFLPISIIYHENFNGNVITIKRSTSLRGSRCTIYFIDNRFGDCITVIDKKGLI